MPKAKAQQLRRPTRVPQKRSYPAAPPVGYITDTYISGIDDSHQPFALWVPLHYTPRRAYPVIVALHGTDADERMIPEQCFRLHERPFREDVILLSPLGRGDLWFERMGETDLWEALDWVRTRYRIDPRRQYLTGLSMGGYACWRLACRYPGQWAAIAPICGGGDPELIRRLRSVPVWCVHGSDDPDVPVSESRELVEELRRLNYPHRYDELLGWEHNSWDWIYAPDRREDTLVDWFLQFRKSRGAPPRRAPDRDGVFHDLFSERVIISYPAQTGIPRETELLRDVAETFSHYTAGDTIMRTGKLLVKSDQELTPDDLETASHLMIGRSDNHRLLKKASSRLLARHHRGQLQVGRRNYLGKTLIAATVQPSPWNRDRLLGILTYQQFRSLKGVAERLIQEDDLAAINLYDAQQGRFLLGDSG